MGSYWIRHRLCFSAVFCVALAAIIGLLFVFPVISQEAEIYNSQSVYENSDIDFIVPEPSFEQVSSLSGSYGIGKVFPYFLTDADLSVKGKTRSTTVLLSDQLQNLDMTMYNEKRLISKSDTEYDNPVLADWRFCHDTSAGIGDTVSFSIGDEIQEYRIYAIYETNSVFGSALLVGLSSKQKDLITEQSDSHGYSAMFVSADDYGTCRSYLTTEYRPLGRLRSRDEFDNEEKYQIHENAILSGDYSNEITDFRVNAGSLGKNSNSLLIWLGAALAMLAIIVFNIVMAKRGVEEPYFTRHCIPRGQDVRSYYFITFVVEILISAIILLVVLALKKGSSDVYIVNMFGGAKAFIVIAAIIIAEVVSLSLNNSRLRTAGSAGHVTIPLKTDSEQSEKSDSQVHITDTERNPTIPVKAVNEQSERTAESGTPVENDGSSVASPDNHEE